MKSMEREREMLIGSVYEHYYKHYYNLNANVLPFKYE